MPGPCSRLSKEGGPAGIRPTLAAVLAVLTLAAPAQARKHPFPRHKECFTARCARHADRLWAKHHPPPKPRWAIPAYVVMCESGGRNLSPNYASAAGYYQITSGTWPEGGGRPPNNASLHSKAEQDAVARRLWAGGAGASRWECA